MIYILLNIHTMARFSLSILSVLFVLAALVLSMPVKRDEDKAPGLGLDSALGPLNVRASHHPHIMY